MEKLEVMVQDLMWEKKGDGVGDKKKKKKCSFSVRSLPSVFFLLGVKIPDLKC